MSYIAGVLVVVTLLLLSGLHVYWARGGRWGLEAAIPVVDGRPAFQPGVAATLAVAALLFIAAILVAGRLARVESPGARVFSWGPWGVAAAFFLRAVGDFRLLGFFKRASNTKFAEWDSKLFSPLCLILALLTLSAILATA